MRRIPDSRIPALAVGVLLCLLLAGCSRHFTPWVRNVELGGVAFRRMRCALDHGDTLLVLGQAAEAVTVQGIPCAADWLHLGPDQEPRLFRLAAPCRIDGVELPADSWVRLRPAGDPNGRVVCTFPGTTVIQGHACLGGGGVKGPQTGFHPGGALQGFHGAGDPVIQGVPCRGGVLHPIRLHPDGSLGECTLARDTVIGGVPCRKHRRIRLDPEGRLLDSP